VAPPRKGRESSSNFCHYIAHSVKVDGRPAGSLGAASPGIALRGWAGWLLRHLATKRI